MGIGVALYLKQHQVITDFLHSISLLGIKTIADEEGQQFHLTLMNGDLGNTDNLIKNVAGLDVPSAVRTGKVEFFEGDGAVAYVAVAESTKNELMKCQEAVCKAALSSSIAIRDPYESSRWIPHISIAGKLTDQEVSNIAQFAKDLPMLNLEVLGYGVATWKNGVVTKEREWRTTDA